MSNSKANLYGVVLTSVIFLTGCGGGSDSSIENSSIEDSSIENSPSTNEGSTNEGSTNSSSIVINEVVAIADDGGDDWIELYVIDGIVNLAEFTITDNKLDRIPQALPDVSLTAGEFIVIAAINEEDTPPENAYYVTFKLGSEDSVFLFQNEVLVSELSWQDGDASEPFSYGLSIDGGDIAQTLTPTPGSANITADIAPEIINADTVINNGAELRINEIVAKDGDGNADWIEFYVTGDSSINLGDYQIADDSGVLYPLPNISLAAGEFYTIYAGTGEVTSGASVGFKLGASDSVQLYKEEDLIDQLEWDKGDALYSFSWGRYPDGSDAIKTLSPTYGSNNESAQRGPLLLNEVLANDPAGGHDWFELYNSGDSKIELGDYSVIDESDDIDPTSLPSVTLYPGEFLVIYASNEDPGEYFVPFKLGNSDELSLILDDETIDYIDWDDSDVPDAYSYGLSPDGSWNHDALTPSPGATNAKVSFFKRETIESVYINIDSSEWNDLIANALEEEYHPASITYQNVTLDSVAIRAKGGSSLRSLSRSATERFSFKVDVNEYVDGQRLLGKKKFVLNNFFNDPSYMREVITYDLMAEMGVPSSQSAYVNVYINNELLGLYLLVEVLDSEYLDRHFDNTEGDLYKPDGTGSDLVWIDDKFVSYSGVSAESNESTSDHGAFIQFIDELNRGNADSVVDVDTLLRYMAVSTTLSNLDSYHGSLAHNYYLYERDGVFSMLPWDFNESFGSFNTACSKDIRELYINEPTSGATMDERPLVGNIFANSNSLATYHSYIEALIDGPLTSDNFAERIESLAELISEAVSKDPTAFYSASDFSNNIASTTVDRFYGLQAFIEYRASNIRAQLAGTATSGNNGNGFCESGSAGGPGGAPPG